MFKVLLLCTAVLLTVSVQKAEMKNSLSVTLSRMKKNSYDFKEKAFREALDRFMEHIRMINELSEPSTSNVLERKSPEFVFKRNGAQNQNLYDPSEAEGPRETRDWMTRIG